MWGEVTPAERLRAVTRRRVDEDRLAIEAADALAGFASEPASLVVACRRVLAHHRSCGPLWWVCSRILAAADPAMGAHEASRLLEADRTADRLGRDAAAARRRPGRRGGRLARSGRPRADRAARRRRGRAAGRRRRSRARAAAPRERTRRAHRRSVGSRAHRRRPLPRAGRRDRARAVSRARGHRPTRSTRSARRCARSGSSAVSVGCCPPALYDVVRQATLAAPTSFADDAPPVEELADRARRLHRRAAGRAARDRRRRRAPTARSCRSCCARSTEPSDGRGSDVDDVARPARAAGPEPVDATAEAALQHAARPRGGVGGNSSSSPTAPVTKPGTKSSTPPANTSAASISSFVGTTPCVDLVAHPPQHREALAPREPRAHDREQEEQPDRVERRRCCARPGSRRVISTIGSTTNTSARTRARREPTEPTVRGHQSSASERVRRRRRCAGR